MKTGESRRPCIANGNKHQIGGVEFFIRRMSNDDIPPDNPDSFEKFWKSIDPKKKPNVIGTLCPKFQDLDRATKLVEVLDALRNKGYQLFFWVMENQYGTDRAIAETDISRLRTFGTVEVMTGIQEADARANNFKRFVTGVVLA